MYCSFAHSHLQQQYCHCWKLIETSSEVGVDTCCQFVEFLLLKQNDFSAHLEFQEESEVAESEVWI